MFDLSGALLYDEQDEASHNEANGKDGTQRVHNGSSKLSIRVMEGSRKGEGAGEKWRGGEGGIGGELEAKEGKMNEFSTTCTCTRNCSIDGSLTAQRTAISEVQ